MAAQRYRLAFDVDSELHRELKKLAARKGVSINQLCVDILERRVKNERFGPLTAEEAPLLAELWDNEEDAVYDDAE